MRKRSLAAAVVVALALAPGTLVRTAIPRGDEIDLSIVAIDDLPNVQAYLKRITSRPAYIKAMEIAGPQAQPPTE